MGTLTSFVTVLLLLQRCFAYAPDMKKAATEFLEDMNEHARIYRHLSSIASYTYHTNMTEYNRKQVQQTTSAAAEFFKSKRAELLAQGFDSIEEEYIKRQIRVYRKIGFYILPEDQEKEVNSAIDNMTLNYAKTKVCLYQERDKCNLPLDGGLDEIMVKSRDPDELKHYWVEWYDKAGTPSKNDFMTLLRLSKRSAELHGYASQADYWISAYEDGFFEDNVRKAYEKILPLYKKIHAYVRYKLQQNYGNKIVSNRGPIPMHLLGNLWGQSWVSVMDIIKPYPDRPVFDITETMKKQGYTTSRIFQMGDEFFQSMNMTKLPPEFWNNSMLERPKDGRDVVCHASAWDMLDENDVRISQCTNIDMSHFYTTHHELGHIQYYLQYQHQPTPFRNGPNPGFHEAVGDVISLSVSTPKHLKKVNLLNIDKLDNETRINKLLSTALAKVAFLPFAYWIDLYRWKLYRGEIDEAEYNKVFWKLRIELTGVQPPVKRSNTMFDPPAKYHISSNVEYMRYFCSFIFQFQFYKAACIRAGEYNPKNPDQFPLDNCDFYNSTEAGNAFKQMLSLGSSLHWRDTLQNFTGQRDMNPSALLEYFQPLEIWLDEEIKTNHIPVGWTSASISMFGFDLRILGLSLITFYLVQK